MSGGDFVRIAGTVDELAFQTKLLALNAAFEAARSQEAGRSLARLAIEMSRLVDRSTRAVGDIRASVDERRARAHRRREDAAKQDAPGAASGSDANAPTGAYPGSERRRRGRPWTASSKKKRPGASKGRPSDGEGTDIPDD